MTRIFFSLYVFIVLTLIVLSAILNQLFFASEMKQQPAMLQSLVLSLETLNQQEQLNIEQLNRLELRAHQTDLNGVAWSEDDQQRLEMGHAVILYAQDGSALVYLQTPSNKLMEIALPSTSIDTWKNTLYSSLFFALLAAGIALWVWPLWRDLRKLQESAKLIDPNGQFNPIEVESHSVVYPIATAINELGTRVRQLLATQLELTGAVAHELRTPLSRLQFALAAISHQYPDQYEAIQTDLDEMEKLLHEMLSYTSLESQQHELSVAEIPILRLCEDRISKLPEQHIRTKEILLRGHECTILADEHYVQSVLDNLLLNAVRYAKSRIEISICQSQDYLTIKIEDDGKGLKPQHYDRVFEPFFRSDPSRDRKKGGAGLGLAIVKRIMLWHQGNCWAEASHLGGARFCIAFPLRARGA